MQTYKLQVLDLVFKETPTKDIGLRLAYQSMHIINDMTGTRMVTLGTYRWSKKKKLFSFVLTENPVVDLDLLKFILHRIYDCGLLEDMGFMCNLSDEEIAETFGSNWKLP